MKYRTRIVLGILTFVLLQSPVLAPLLDAGHAAQARPYHKEHGKGHFKHRHHRYKHHRHGFGAQVVFLAPGPHAAWHHQDSYYADDYYAPPPAPEYTNDNNSYCREYFSKVNVAGRLQDTYGTACQQPDGSWKIIN